MVDMRHSTPKKVINQMGQIWAIWAMKRLINGSTGQCLLEEPDINWTNGIKQSVSEKMQTVSAEFVPSSYRRLCPMRRNWLPRSSGLKFCCKLEKGPPSLRRWWE
jgi:hypothetical protein